MHGSSPASLVIVVVVNNHSWRATRLVINFLNRDVLFDREARGVAADWLGACQQGVGHVSDTCALPPFFRFGSCFVVQLANNQ